MLLLLLTRLRTAVPRGISASRCHKSMGHPYVGIDIKVIDMPDGTRKRRFSLNQARRRWYATHRAARFFRRFGLTNAVAA